jgi:hypothetical protein
LGNSEKSTFTTGGSSSVTRGLAARRSVLWPSELSAWRSAADASRARFAVRLLPFALWRSISVTAVEGTIKQTS